MTLSPGVRLGPYEILAPLGAGGMGEVFRARDTRLNRSVAIKILPADLADDPDFRQRFQTEARAVSSLNHPHICTLYDVGAVPDPSAVGAEPLDSAQGRLGRPELQFLVMELLEGETLARRLVRGPLPFDQLLRTATEIASALDAAHAHGVTHRDLKPSNVMLTKSGAKLLDFGLAKLQRPLASRGQTTRTVDPALTREGAILGTFPYMAPEQIEGNDVDARVDLFAFGAVLYEMATGRKAFDGQTQASLTAAILEREPPPLSDPRIPPAFDHVIRRCLAKDPDERWQSARDVLFELKWIAERGVEDLARARTSRPRTVLAGSIAVAVALAATATIALRFRTPPAESAAAAQLDVSLPVGASFFTRQIRTGLAVSPDGRHVAIVAIRDGRAQLWLRSLDSPTARVLPGTDGAVSPFWSPDSRFVGFVAAGKLQRADLSGGPPQPICDANVETTPTWGRNGTILFAELSARGEGIFRVSAAGGPVTQVTRVNRARDEREHFWPSFFPDGIRFFYLVSTFHPDTNSLTHAVYVASLDGPDATRVADVESRMTYAPPGRVLYAHDGALLARNFDVQALQFVGDPLLVAERLWHFKPSGLAEFSVSDNGVLAFQEGTGLSELVWFDRTGKQLETIGARAAFSGVRLSPDGRRIAVEVTDPRSGSFYLTMYDQQSGIPNQFTPDAKMAGAPVWSGDGLHVFFESGSEGPPDLYRKRADGRGETELLVPLPGVQLPNDASLDGRHLVYTQFDRTTGPDLWVLPLVGRRTPWPYLASPADEGGARFSPDGRWLAFVSTESGGPEVYVAPMDEPRARQRVSSAGGIGPRWRRDGKELIYLSPGNMLMAVSLSLGPEGTRDVPRPLFTPGPVFNTFVSNSWGDPAYDIDADGQRFLVDRVIKDAATAPIKVVLNWPALLRK